MTQSELGGEASGSFVVSPHTDDLNCVLGVMDLIHQAMLDVDATGIGARQISDELFVWRRLLKRILRDDIEKTLRLWPEVRRRKFPGVLLRLFGVNNRPIHQPGLVEDLPRGSAMPLRMESRIPGIEMR